MEINVECFPTAAAGNYTTETFRRFGSLDPHFTQYKYLLLVNFDLSYVYASDVPFEIYYIFIKILYLSTK